MSLAERIEIACWYASRFRKHVDELQYEELGECAT
jgi:hypothetical protein